jgi:hypothetical protein
MRTAPAAFAALLFLFSCGGGPGAFTGTVAGKSLTVKGAVFLQSQEIWLVGFDDPCRHLSANQFPKGGSLLKIIPHPPAKRDFNVVLSGVADGTASMQFLQLDDSCNNTLAFGASAATMGTLGIDSLEAMKAASGNFDVTFGNADHVTGSFNAGSCDAPVLYPAPECIELD